MMKPACLKPSIMLMKCMHFITLLIKEAQFITHGLVALLRPIVPPHPHSHVLSALRREAIEMEVTHSPRGMEMLRHFLFDVCGVVADWKMQDVLEEEVKAIKEMVGPDEHVVCALSGGVDSTVAATLVHIAIGDRLHCVFVDNGLLRYKERERVMSTFQTDLHLPVTCIDASDQFLSKFKGVKDPECKRKIIGREFISIFDDFAQLLKKLGKKPTFLVQDTLYPDVIESCPPPESERTHSHTIKSHHNCDDPRVTKI